MTFIGIIANFILKQKIPSLIEPIIGTLSDSFSAIALFYLGFTMVGRIKHLTFSSVIIILILIFTKSLLFPLITREVVFHLNSNNSNQSESLSTFGFLYGTFPTAPSLFFYLTRYKSIAVDLISAALVFGTLASAPLMMISGKMISIQYENHSSTNFDDIQCKTAYGFSILSWFCCLWVLYVFIAAGKLFKRPFRYTFFLLISQMLNSLVHIIWTNLTNKIDDLNWMTSLTYVGFTLFSAFLTRCWILSLMLKIISISGVERYNKSKLNHILFKLANSEFGAYFIGILIPVSFTGICLTAGGIPEKQNMMASLGRAQIIITCVLLSFIILSVAYCMIVFARTKFEQFSFVSLLRENQPRSRYFSLSKESHRSNANDLENGTDVNFLGEQKNDEIKDNGKNKHL